MGNKKYAYGIFLFCICGHVNAENLCKIDENVIFAFSTSKKNELSVCKKMDGAYLVYRYGRAEEFFQYPKNLTRKSWDKFSFSGMMRSGGKVNAGFGDYDLTFSNGDYTYSVFQKWNDEDDTYNIGVAVKNEKTKRLTNIYGMKETQEGSLVLLENEGELIENTAQ